MAKKPKPESDDKRQSQRFVETAKALGIEESNKSFQRAMSAIIPKKNKSSHKKSRG